MASNQVVKGGLKSSMTSSRTLDSGIPKPDPCIWMSKIKNLKCYEYLATYVDDQCIAAQDPGKVIQTLKETTSSRLNVMDH